MFSEAHTMWCNVFASWMWQATVNNIIIIIIIIIITTTTTSY